MALDACPRNVSMVYGNLALQGTLVIEKIALSRQKKRINRRLGDVRPCVEGQAAAMKGGG
jgi:hypothetical protein